MRAIENVYDILLDLEEERRPGGSPLTDERRQELLDRLWNELGVMEPIDQGYTLIFYNLLTVETKSIPSFHFYRISKAKRPCPECFSLLMGTNV